MRRVSPVVVLVAALTAIAVAAAVFVVVGAVRTSHENAVAARGQAALAAGTQVVVDLTSLNYEQLDQEFRRNAQLGTSNFRTHYLDVSNAAAELLVKTKTMSKGAVVARGISELGAHSAILAFALNSTVTDTSHPTATTSYQRVIVQMQLMNGRWLINSENFVQ